MRQRRDKLGTEAKLLATPRTASITCNVILLGGGGGEEEKEEEEEEEEEG